MAFPNMAIPRQQMIGGHCDISSKNKGTYILEAARYREWESRISVGVPGHYCWSLCHASNQGFMTSKPASVINDRAAQNDCDTEPPI